MSARHLIILLFTLSVFAWSQDKNDLRAIAGESNEQEHEMVSEQFNPYLDLLDEIGPDKIFMNHEYIIIKKIKETLNNSQKMKGVEIIGNRIDVRTQEHPELTDVRIAFLAFAGRLRSSSLRNHCIKTLVNKGYKVEDIPLLDFIWRDSKDNFMNSWDERVDTAFKQSQQKQDTSLSFTEVQEMSDEEYQLLLQYQIDLRDEVLRDLETNFFMALSTSSKRAFLSTLYEIISDDDSVTIVSYFEGITIDMAKAARNARLQVLKEVKGESRD